MDAIGIAIVFAVTWWLVFFMTLPFGVRAPDEPGPGHAPSAPERPRVALKAAITTAVAAAITGLAAAAVEYDIISFREWMRLEP
jgi:predicted secreted protein